MPKNSTYNTSCFWSLLFVLARYGLGVMFLFSAVMHILHDREFLSSIIAYKLTPLNVSTFLAAVLPWLQVSVGICLLSEAFLEGALLVAMLLLGIYTAAIAIVVFQGIAIDCGCSLTMEKSSPVSYWNIMRNMALFVITAILYLRETSWWRLHMFNPELVRSNTISV